MYILSNTRHGVLYVGVTNDFSRRVFEHKSRSLPAVTGKYGVVLLVYFEEYASIVEARAREASLKRWRRAWKIALVETLNPNWRDLAADLPL